MIEKEDVYCKECGYWDNSNCEYYGTKASGDTFWSFCAGFKIKKVLPVPLPSPKKKRTNRKAKKVSNTG